MTRIRPIGQALTLALTILMAGSAAAADPPLPEISQTGVFRTDVVAAQEGSPTVGSPALAVRDGTTVHYLATSATHEKFATNPKAYPDVEQGVLLALMGADPVLRFPNGVRDTAIGPIVAGDPGKYVAEHKGAWFAFATEATLAAFRSNPERYAPPVGAYCLGAMSRKGITPGDPRHTLYLPEEKTWAVYGSANGPKTWVDMAPEERRQALAAAQAYYRERTGVSPARPTAP